MTGSDGKSKKMQILTTKKVEVKEFFNKFFIPTVQKLPMHVKIMILQWAVFKENPKLPLQEDSEQFIIIRTREDFQEDLEVLLREETVSTHRGHGKTSIVGGGITVHE